VPVTQILFGSDNPYIPLEETVNGLVRLGLSTADLRAIARDNTLSLLTGPEKRNESLRD
jgi:predicted TIM-barrel fold metal-dependent hydrolase